MGVSIPEAATEGAVNADEEKEGDDASGDKEAEEDEDEPPIPPYSQLETTEHWPEYQQSGFPPPATATHRPVEAIEGNNTVPQGVALVPIGLAVPVMVMASPPSVGQIVQPSCHPHKSSGPLHDPPSNCPDPIPSTHSGTDEPPPASLPSDQPFSSAVSKKPSLKRQESTTGNCIRVTWKIPAGKFRKGDPCITSPDFEFWDGKLFRVILKSSGCVKGGFLGSKGVGKVELKLCGETELGEEATVYYRVAAGKRKQLTQDGQHDFATQSLSILPQEWNFLSVKDGDSVLLYVEARQTQ